MATREEILEELANALRGEQNPKLVNDYLLEASEKLDEDESEIIVELETDYDCIQCMHCSSYFELADMHPDSDDGHCKDCYEE